MTRNVTVTLDDETVDRLDSYVRENMMNRAGVIRDLVQVYLEKVRHTDKRHSEIIDAFRDT